MEARDRTEKKTDYKGRPTACCESVCPCRPCWNAHDCGYNDRVYRDGNWVSNRWVERMECATRHNDGCPSPKPEPEHVYVSERGRVCKRCGARRPPKGQREAETDG